MVVPLGIRVVTVRKLFTHIYTSQLGLPFSGAAYFCYVSYLYADQFHKFVFNAVRPPALEVLASVSDSTCKATTSSAVDVLASVSDSASDEAIRGND